MHEMNKQLICVYCEKDSFLYKYVIIIYIYIGIAAIGTTGQTWIIKMYCEIVGIYIMHSNCIYTITYNYILW